jgi:hypothetical protein
MQERILIDGVQIKQPDSFDPNWETTYTEDSGRVMSGVAELDPLFTVESFSVEWSYLKPEEVSQILQLIVPTQNKKHFQMRYFSWYTGMWKTGTFYVGKGTLKTKTLKSDYETFESLSCNIIGVNPL